MNAKHSSVFYVSLHETLPTVGQRPTCVSAVCAVHQANGHTLLDVAGALEAVPDLSLSDAARADPEQAAQ